MAQEVGRLSTYHTVGGSIPGSLPGIQTETQSAPSGCAIGVWVVFAPDELCHQCMNVSGWVLAHVVKCFEWLVRLEKSYINTVHLPCTIYWCWGNILEDSTRRCSIVLQVGEYPQFQTWTMAWVHLHISSEYWCSQHRMQHTYSNKHNLLTFVNKLIMNKTCLLCVWTQNNNKAFTYCMWHGLTWIGSASNDY